MRFTIYFRPDFNFLFTQLSYTFWLHISFRLFSWICRFRLVIIMIFHFLGTHLIHKFQIYIFQLHIFDTHISVAMFHSQNSFAKFIRKIHSQNSFANNLYGGTHSSWRVVARRTFQYRNHPCTNPTIFIYFSHNSRTTDRGT
jgi:hypothetical protein